jgi:2-amino-4-hydroxy-6-hydroxymethyldihydropteridine diphosphokinase
LNLRHTVYISVGSNLGRKLDNCRAGIGALTDSSHVRLIKQSPVYRTEPVDYEDQDWFVNYVVKVETIFNPMKLLELIHSVEHSAGRMRESIRFGPRVLDLDILLFDDLVRDDSTLTIPHPRMHKRRFVLKPICDIDPDIHHPVLQQTMASLLKNLSDAEQRIIEYK